MEDEGYLFFRGVVPAAEILPVRRAVLELCEAAGWLAPGTELMDGIASPDQVPLTEGQPDYMAVYRQVLRTPTFHAFPAQPALMALAGAILDLPASEVLVHPRRIGRITFPANERATTPAHQDHHYIRGAVETYSCWVPLGDCPTELGGLAVWPGSHKNGYLDHTVQVKGAVGGSAVPIDDSVTAWHSGDFKMGDAILFHSHTIHKALPNVTPDRLRISTDNRYQRPKDDIDPRALLPHYPSNK
jgi:ectoine hydroxylase-related dioxygenase (phytanoyl-CoA dioxygenase family)